MCGIAGFLTSRHWPQDPQSFLYGMASAITYRGPDDDGYWVDQDNGVGLGHRRLSIIDLSPGGHQPMTSASGRYVMAYNGEIYNFEELRLELAAAGAAPSWRGHSDTEVFLAAMDAWGIVGTLQRANGMFALAVWDRQTKTLTLARDRLGEKPLYYGHADGRLIFCSELKGLLAAPGFVRTVNREAAAAFMRLSYIPAPLTIWRGVHKLPPAHYLELDRAAAEAGTMLAPRPYWSAADVAKRGDDDPAIANDVLTDRLETLLQDAVALRMRADVPVGAFLSGGVDSSLVTALMRKCSTRPVKTFSIGFDEPGYDEAVHARAVATHLGTDHTEHYVSAADVAATLPQLPTIWDEPFGDSSQVPTYLVSRLAREQVTIALSGDGGDELFGGYNRHVLGDRLWRGAQHVPTGLRRAMARSLSSPTIVRAIEAATHLLPPNRRPNALAERLPKVGAILSAGSIGEIYGRLISQWGDEPVIRGEQAYRPVFPDVSAFQDFRHAMMFMDMTTYLPDDILVKVDRAGMAVSLEGRVPLLDHRVVEFAWAVPLSAKIRDGTGKAILREILFRHVPRALIERPKAGFAAPIARWLATGPLRDWAETLLEPTALDRIGLLESAPVLRMWSRLKAGDQAAFGQVWNALMLQAWALGPAGLAVTPPVAAEPVRQPAPV